MSLSHELLRTIIIGVSFVFSHIESSGQNIRIDSRDVESTKSEEIPLDQVWSIHIPGTRDIFELEPVPPKEMTTVREVRGKLVSDTLTYEIARKLYRGKRGSWSDDNRPPAREMFAVLGHGQTALLAAHAVLVKGVDPPKSFSRGDDITLVFFSLRSRPIHFRRIMREGNKITIHYQFVYPAGIIRINLERPHLALIPINSVQPNELVTELERVPTDTPIDEREILEIEAREPTSYISISRTISRPCRIPIE